MRFASHKPGTHFRALFCLSLFLLPVGLQAGNIVAVQDEEGRTVYVNIVKAGSPGTSTYKMVLRPIPDPKIGALVKSVSKAHQMDPKLVQAVIQVELDYNPNAVSRKGAQGLMQLIPSTARAYGVKDPFDPKQNIEGGVKHLKDLMDNYEGNLRLTLAGYNAGMGAVARYGDIPPFRETQRYVRKVFGTLREREQADGPKLPPPSRRDSSLCGRTGSCPLYQRGSLNTRIRSMKEIVSGSGREQRP